MISLEEYAREVRLMRQTQQAFEGGNKAVLADARRRERIVDRLTKEVLEGRQAELFDIGGEAGGP